MRDGDMWGIFIFFMMFMCSATVYGALPDMMLCDGGYPVMTVTEITDEAAETTTKTVEYSCQKYVANDYCADNYITVNLFGIGMPRTDGTCPEATHRMRNHGVYMLNQIPVTMCENGYFDGVGCVSYAPDTENCPAGYNNVFSNDSIRVVANGLDCPAGTRLVSPYDGSNLTDNSLISIHGYPYTDVLDTKLAVRLCAAGQDMNYLGNCANLCALTSTGVSMRYLRTGGGLVIPIYATKLTTPSLNFKSGNRQCYVNLVPEKSKGAINIMYEDNFYHAVK
jgi:hypothetical protein